jgi:SAM-dependent methyltransferase
LRDQPAGLAECHRVLRADGRLFLSTPNRHSLGPDPHTGVPAGGWLPDAVTGTYVRRKGGVPPRRHLVTTRELRTLLADAGFHDVTIGAPRVPALQREQFGAIGRVAIDSYNVVARLPGGAALLRIIGPLLHASARRPASAA